MGIVSQRRKERKGHIQLQGPAQGTAPASESFESRHSKPLLGRCKDALILCAFGAILCPGNLAHPTNPAYYSFKTKTKKTLCVSIKGQSPLPSDDDADTKENLENRLSRREARCPGGPQPLHRRKAMFGAHATDEWFRGHTVDARVQPPCERLSDQTRT